MKSQKINSIYLSGVLTDAGKNDLWDHLDGKKIHKNADYQNQDSSM